MGIVYKLWEFSVDIKRPGTIQPFRAVREDNSNVFVIHVLNDSVPVDLTGAKVSIIYTAPKGVYMQDEESGVSVADVEQGIVRVDVNTGKLSSGNVTAELQIISGDGEDTLMTTSQFKFSCRPSILSAETIQEMSEFPPLIYLMDRVEGLVDDAQEAGDYAQRMGDYAKQRGDEATPATLRFGEVETLPPDEEAYAINVGDEKNAVLNLGIPQGLPGEGNVDTVNGRPGPNVTLRAEHIPATPPESHANWDTVQKYLDGLSGTAIAPLDVVAFAAVPGNAVVTLTWQDPADIMVGGTPIVWAGTKIVRKPGSDPANENDGTVVVNSTVRDQYKTAGFADTGLVNGTTYHYQAFPQSTDGGINRNETNRVSATPSDEYLENMLQFFAIPGSTGKIRLKAKKPEDADGVMFRYKTSKWIEGDDETTGTLAGNITDDSAYNGHNQWYEINGLTNGTTYYPKAFPYKNGEYNRTIGVNEWVCQAGKLSFEQTGDSWAGSTISDTSGNGNNGTATNVTAAPGLVGDQMVFNGTNSSIKYATPFSDATVRAFSAILTCPASPTGIVLSLGNADGYPWFVFEMGGWTAAKQIRYVGVTGGDVAKGATINYDFANKRAVLVCNLPGISGSASDIKVWIDNILQTLTYTGSAAVKAQTGESLIGATWQTPPSTRLYFNGQLDQVRFFSGNLLPEEVTALTNGGAGC